MSAYLATALLAALAVLAAWRQTDRRRDSRAWQSLLAATDKEPATFEPDALGELPEPAQRYFRFMIQRGAVLHAAVELDMTGQIGLGSRVQPNYRPMQARQLLAPPHGLVWQLRAGSISGSDGSLPDTSWTRFWLFGLLPVVRAGGTDHQRSAFGRVVAEAAFWAPASLLPGENVRWEAVDWNCARAVVRFGALEQAVDITIGEDGAPAQVSIQRWSNANAEKRWQAQPFGGYLSDFRSFGGYRLPTRVEGGNHFGTPDYFPFFKATVQDARFPDSTTRDLL